MAGASGAAVLETLQTANGPGSLQDPSGGFVTKDQQDLPAGDYAFHPPGGPAKSQISFCAYAPIDILCMRVACLLLALCQHHDPRCPWQPADLSTGTAACPHWQT